MRKLLKRLKKEEKGFTLIELLAVIVILAVIAVIAVPLIGKIINNSKADSDVATARQVYDAAKLYVTGELDGSYADKDTADSVSELVVTFKNLYDKGYMASDTSLPSSKTPLNDTTTAVQFNSDGSLDHVTLNGTSYDITIINNGKASR